MINYYLIIIINIFVIPFFFWLYSVSMDSKKKKENEGVNGWNANKIILNTELNVHR